jgi:hypothetical protein
MTRAELLKRLRTNEAIADVFRSFGERITVQAVQQWPMNKPIPRLREMQLLVNRPKLFPQRKRRA